MPDSRARVCAFVKEDLLPLEPLPLRGGFGALLPAMVEAQGCGPWSAHLPKDEEPEPRPERAAQAHGGRIYDGPGEVHHDAVAREEVKRCGSSVQR
jgi:hypothetical protein